MVAPKDVYAVQINNQLKGAVNATLTYSKGMSNELLVEKKHIPAGTSWKSGPYDYQEVRAWVHLGCGGPTWVLVWGKCASRVGLCMYRVIESKTRPFGPLFDHPYGPDTILTRSIHIPPNPHPHTHRARPPSTTWCRPCASGGSSRPGRHPWESARCPTRRRSRCS